MGAVSAWGWGRTGDIVVPDPKSDIDGVEDCKKGEPPANSVNDDLLATLEELVDDSPEEKEVNKRPDPTLEQEHK